MGIGIGRPQPGGGGGGGAQGPNFYIWGTGTSGFSAVRRYIREAGPNCAMRHIFIAAGAREILINNYVGMKWY
jgi:hypothetical protein